MRRPPITDEAERIDVIAGLLQLKKDGHFHQIWVGMQIRVQYAVDGPIKLLGWRKAQDMVRTARAASAALLAAEFPAQRKPAAPERSGSAAAASSGKTR